ncbi:MAG: HAMP domain-containing histidine kinase [Oscillospiraceae bacterium]|nr:HAMP domain-containing histidine kinase [Oscillospiraceae bacterium]
MIQKIKIRFISLAMIALFILLCAIVTGMNIVNYNTIVSDADTKLELLSKNQGIFPEFGSDKKWPMPPNMTMETPYESRYFSILFSSAGEVIHTDTSRIKAIDSTSAVQYANQAIQTNHISDFIDHYRFLVSSEGNAVRISFLDCTREISSFRSFLMISICMALAGYAAFFFVLLFFSNRFLRPITESYEKQKRFITDAGHEIKTPLAIIKADVDVLEMEYGENEWLSAIQSQVKRLSDLTNDLVYLSRMEETEDTMQMIDFPFSDVICETAHSFDAVAQAKGKIFQCSVQPMLSLNGNEKSIRQLVNILLDNAMKYSPEGGFVSLSAGRQGRYLSLSVQNTTIVPVEKKDLSHIFERFYRMDASRNSQTGGYGIGLSVAKAIVAAHNGRISATTEDGHSLQISVQFPV